jgi:hypothetical protein
LNTELEILKSLLRNPSTNKPIILFYRRKTARILLQMKYQFENDLGILNYLSGTNEKSAIVLTQPEMELKPLIAPGSSI